MSKWEHPKIEHDKPTQWNWIVSNPSNFHLGIETDIGAHCYIQAKHGVLIGDNSQVGGGTKIYSVDSEGGYVGVVRIGECVNIGANCTIFPDVEIGDGATVGAMSMVQRGTRIPAGEEWFGVPAKKRSGDAYAVTGGTGSIGRLIVAELLKRDDVESVRVISKDEYRQSEMAKEMDDSRLRFILADICDKEKMARALEGVHTVIHAAALKRVEWCERNPDETDRVNINGTRTVAGAAMRNKVKRFLFVGTDKAVDPSSLMGMSKAFAERSCMAYNSWSKYTKFWAVRLGNVLGSRGSLVPTIQDCIQKKTPFYLTNPEMTRFFLGREEAASWIVSALDEQPGLHVPKCRACKIGDMVEVLTQGTDCAIVTVGSRPGEKQHEMLLSDEEAKARGVDAPDYRSEDAELLDKDDIRFWLEAENLL